MPEPPIPPPLEDFGDRPFSFYPPILNVEHNEWQFVRSTWSELLIRNTRTGEELWIPRRYLGEISQIDQPVMIVGLTRELELRAGAVWPAQRRIFEMRATEAPRSRQAAEEPGPAAHPVRGFEGKTEKRVGRLIALALILGLVGCVFLIYLFQGARGGRVTYNPILQTDLALTAQDDYFDIIRKLGQPKEDHWRSETGEMQFRILDYSHKGFMVVLMGVERDKARYVGALDRNWRVVHSVKLPGGGDTRAMLQKLQRF
jgi:hypothetical protein